MQSKYPPADFDKTTGKGHLTAPAHEIYPLKELTDHLYNEIDKALPDLSNTNELIFDFVKTTYKGKKAAKFVAAEQLLSDAKNNAQ